MATTKLLSDAQLRSSRMLGGASDAAPAYPPSVSRPLSVFVAACTKPEDRWVRAPQEFAELLLRESAELQARAASDKPFPLSQQLLDRPMPDRASERHVVAFMPATRAKPLQVEPAAAAAVASLPVRLSPAMAALVGAAEQARDEEQQQDSQSTERPDNLSPPVVDPRPPPADGDSSSAAASELLIISPPPENQEPVSDPQSAPSSSSSSAAPSSDESGSSSSGVSSISNLSGLADSSESGAAAGGVKSDDDDDEAEDDDDEDEDDDDDEDSYLDDPVPPGADVEEVLDDFDDILGESTSSADAKGSGDEAESGDDDDEESAVASDIDDDEDDEEDDADYEESSSDDDDSSSSSSDSSSSSESVSADVSLPHKKKHGVVTVTEHEDDEDDDVPIAAALPSRKEARRHDREEDDAEPEQMLLTLDAINEYMSYMYLRDEPSLDTPLRRAMAKPVCREDQRKNHADEEIRALHRFTTLFIVARREDAPLIDLVDLLKERVHERATSKKHGTPAWVALDDMLAMLTTLKGYVHLHEAPLPDGSGESCVTNRCEITGRLVPPESLRRVSAQRSTIASCLVIGETGSIVVGKKVRALLLSIYRLCRPTQAIDDLWRNMDKSLGARAQCGLVYNAMASAECDVRAELANSADAVLHLSK